LKKILKTKKSISRIEAYDVSNIQGQNATGSMVAFINGVPDKNSYRRFRIKISGKPDDVAMLKEVLTRRFSHPEWGWPDLILIDGGKAQLNVAVSSIKCKISGIKIPVLAIAKRENELFIERKEGPVLLKNLPRDIFNLILQLRDEAHRFALSYHKKLREVDLLGKL
jgi:excinuclease ABC subunit C